MLHFYPQYTYHDDVEIIGELEDLIRLRRALDNIIELSRKTNCVEKVYTSNGEGYRIIVEVKTEEEMMKLDPYYTQDHYNYE